MCIELKIRWCIILRKGDAFCTVVLYGIVYLAVGSSLHVCVLEGSIHSFQSKNESLRSSKWFYNLSPIF